MARQLAGATTSGGAIERRPTMGGQLAGACIVEWVGWGDTWPAGWRLQSAVGPLAGATTRSKTQPHASRFMTEGRKRRQACSPGLRGIGRVKSEPNGRAPPPTPLQHLPAASNRGVPAGLPLLVVRSTVGTPYLMVDRFIFGLYSVR